MTTKYRCLNDAGQKAVGKFIEDNAMYPSRHNLSEWFREAEELLLDGGWLLEMRESMTANGRLASMFLKDEHFDA